MDLAAFVALREAFLLVLAGAELTEVLGGSWNGLFEELHFDAA